METKRKKGLLFWVIAIVLAILVGCDVPLPAQAVQQTSQKVFNWNNEGTSPFWKKPVRSEEDLKAVFRDSNFLAKLAKRLPEKEPSWNGKEVTQLAQVAVLNGQAQKITIAPGSEEAEFEWMLAGDTWKSNDDTTVVWNGDHPLNAFLVSIPYKGEDINLFFGNFCVNVLKRHRKAEVPPGEYGVKPPPRAEAPVLQERSEKPVIINNYYYNNSDQSQNQAAPAEAPATNYVPQPQTGWSAYDYRNWLGQNWVPYGYGGYLPQPPIGYSAWDYYSWMLSWMPMQSWWGFNFGRRYDYDFDGFRRQEHFRGNENFGREFNRQPHTRPPTVHTRPPTVHTRPPVNTPSVRPPTVVTRPPAVSSASSVRPPTVRTLPPSVSSTQSAVRSAPSISGSRGVTSMSRGSGSTGMSRGSSGMSRGGGMSRSGGASRGASMRTR